MKNLILLLCLLLGGCGGVVGNLEKYDYDLSKPALDRQVELLLLRYPDYPSREIEARYHVSTQEFPSRYHYLLLPYKGQRLVFGFQTFSLGKRSGLALVYAAPLGELLVLPSHRPLWERWWYTSLFETMFVDKLNQRLKADRAFNAFLEGGAYNVLCSGTPSNLG
jgi:hypothetical protein